MCIPIKIDIHIFVGVNKQLNLCMSYSLSLDRLTLLNKGSKTTTNPDFLAALRRLDRTYNDNEIIAQ